MRKIDLIGRRFDKLTVVAEIGRTAGNRVLWLCICQCGNHISKTTSNLARSRHNSQHKTCGCRECASLAIAAARSTHGGASRTQGKSAIYKRWCDIKTRCYNPRNKRWASYGGKGIRICDEWMDFPTFRTWALAAGFKPSLSIDRINPDGNYEPSNCEWVTSSENTRRMNASRKLRLVS